MDPQQAKRQTQIQPRAEGLSQPNDRVCEPLVERWIREGPGESEAESQGGCEVEAEPDPDEWEGLGPNASHESGTGPEALGDRFTA